MLDIVLSQQRPSECRLHRSEYKKPGRVSFDNKIDRSITKMTNTIINHDVPMFARDLNR
jgi:hypothetical protein